MKTRICALLFVVNIINANTICLKNLAALQGEKLFTDFGDKNSFYLLGISLGKEFDSCAQTHNFYRQIKSHLIDSLDALQQAFNDLIDNKQTMVTYQQDANKIFEIYKEFLTNAAFLSTDKELLISEFDPSTFKKLPESLIFRRPTDFRNIFGQVLKNWDLTDQQKQKETEQNIKATSFSEISFELNESVSDDDSNEDMTIPEEGNKYNVRNMNEPKLILAKERTPDKKDVTRYFK